MKAAALTLAGVSSALAQMAPYGSPFGAPAELAASPLFGFPMAPPVYGYPSIGLLPPMVFPASTTPLSSKDDSSKDDSVNGKVEEEEDEDKLTLFDIARDNLQYRGMSLNKAGANYMGLESGLVGVPGFGVTGATTTLGTGAYVLGNVKHFQGYRDVGQSYYNDAQRYAAENPQMTAEDRRKFKNLKLTGDYWTQYGQGYFLQGLQYAFPQFTGLDTPKLHQAYKSLQKATLIDLQNARRDFLTNTSDPEKLQALRDAERYQDANNRWVTGSGLLAVNGVMNIAKPLIKGGINPVYKKTMAGFAQAGFFSSLSAANKDYENALDDYRASVKAFRQDPSDDNRFEVKQSALKVKQYQAGKTAYQLYSLGSVAGLAKFFGVGNFADLAWLKYDGYAKQVAQNQRRYNRQKFFQQQLKDVPDAAVQTPVIQQFLAMPSYGRQLF